MSLPFPCHLSQSSRAVTSFCPSLNWVTTCVALLKPLVYGHPACHWGERPCCSGQWLCCSWPPLTLSPSAVTEPGVGANFPQRSHLCAFTCSALPSQQHLPVCLQKVPLLICSDGVANWVTQKVLAACCRGPALRGLPARPRLQARRPRELWPSVPSSPFPPQPLCAIPRRAGPFSCLRLTPGSRNP